MESTICYKLTLPTLRKSNLISAPTILLKLLSSASTLHWGSSSLNNFLPPFFDSNSEKTLKSDKSTIFLATLATFPIYQKNQVTPTSSSELFSLQPLQEHISMKDISLGIWWCSATPQLLMKVYQRKAISANAYFTISLTTGTFFLMQVYSKQIFDGQLSISDPSYQLSEERCMQVACALQDF